MIVLDRLVEGGARGHVVGVGVYLDRFQVARLLAGQRVELGDRLDLVAPERNAPGRVLKVGGEDLDRVTAHPERAAGKRLVVALVLLRHEVGEERALVEPVADLHFKRHGGVGLDRADTINAGDRCNDDHVVAFQERAGRSVAHPVDLLVHARLSFSI